MYWFLALGFAAYFLVFRAAGEAWARRWRELSARPASCGRSGEEVARTILSDAGAGDVRVVRGRSAETARFDALRRRIVLGPEVFDGRSVAAVQLAAHAAVESLPGARDNAGGRWRRWVVACSRGGLGMVLVLTVLLAFFRPVLWKVLPFLWLGAALVLLAGHALTLGWEYRIGAEASRRLRRLGWVRATDEDAFEAMRKAVPLRDVTGIGTSLARALGSILPLRGWK